ncbi:hypothetical protein D3C72_2136900 [compost metagenome]
MNDGQVTVGRGEAAASSPLGLTDGFLVGGPCAVDVALPERGQGDVVKCLAQACRVPHGEEELAGALEVRKRLKHVVGHLERKAQRVLGEGAAGLVGRR